MLLNTPALHHVTYSGAKFEAATSNGLGRDAFTCKKIYSLTLTLGQKLGIISSAHFYSSHLGYLPGIS